MTRAYPPAVTLLALVACTDPGPESRVPDPETGTAPRDDSASDSDSAGSDSDTVDTAASIVPVGPGWEGLDALGVKNVVVVHADTLRANRLPPYGGEHDTLPTSSAWPWTVVHGVVGPTSWTIPSTVSMLTAQDTPSHGVVHTTENGSLNHGLEGDTVMAALAGEGFRTAYFVGNQAVPKVDGVIDDFDEVFEAGDKGGYSTNLYLEVGDALEWIDGLPEEQAFFIVMQPMDTHLPYRPAATDLGTWSTDPPFDTEDDEDTQVAAVQAAWAAAETDEEREAMLEEVRAVYDETVLSTDRGLTALIEGLHARGLARDTLVVLASDHGETLGEELEAGGLAAVGHGGTVRPELVRLPLMFYNPALPAQEIDCLSANYDVLPTVRRALGLPDLAGVDGLAMQDGCRDVVRTSFWSSDTDYDIVRELGATDGTSFLRWKCISGQAFRYDLSVDTTATTTVDAADFPAEAVLTAEIEDYLDDVRDTIAHTVCTVDGVTHG